MLFVYLPEAHWTWNGMMMRLEKWRHIMSTYCQISLIKDLIHACVSVTGITTVRETFETMKIFTIMMGKLTITLVLVCLLLL